MPASSLEAAAYASVRVLAEILGRQSRRTLDRPAQGFAGATFRTPLGDIADRSADPARDLAGRRSAASRAPAFRTVSLTKGVAPDPYLSRYDRAETFGRPRLKVVS